VCDREILETYLNSASKNTIDTDIFPHGPKSLLTMLLMLCFSIPLRDISLLSPDEIITTLADVM